MKQLPCGCCTGLEAITPVAITNRPGLSAIAYRIGTYATLFETMKAGLSSPDFPALAALRTREADDPAIALLDAWAVIADVLTFYQERIANEGYLRTATDRQSVINLAQLVGYALRPGVSASVYLAYTVDPNSVTVTTIPAGSRVQSQPAAPGALPQTFEIEGDLSAQGAWNNLTPRLTQPQVITASTTDFYVSGVNTNLKPNDPVAIVASDPVLSRVATVEAQFDQKRTLVVLQTATPSASASLPVSPSLTETSVALLKPLMIPPARHPANSLELDRSVSQVFAPSADTTPALLSALHPTLQTQIYASLANTMIPPAPGQVFALRVQAAPFGSTAPLKPIVDSTGAVTGTEEWPLAGSTIILMVISSAAQAEKEEQNNRAFEAINARGQATVFIKITDPTTSASRTFSLSQKAADNKIGSWRVELKLEQDTGLVAVFSPSLPTFKLGYEKDTETLSVTVDGGEPVQVLAGQTASTATNGQRTSVSAAKNIVIRYESATAPDGTVLALDSIYDQILPGSMVVIERPDWKAPRFTTVTSTQRVAITRYNLSSKVTQLKLADEWLDPATDRMLSAVRPATISTQSEQLGLAPQPVTDDVSGGTIELGDLYSDLDSGRWMMVRGERTDTPTSGVTGTELVMLAGVDQGVKQVAVPPAPASSSRTTAEGSATTPPPTTQPLPGDTTHSFINLAQPLSYTYKRNSVTVSGNVVRATHGESRSEVLGSGDGTQSMQQFQLHYPQVTYVPATTAGGAQSTLQVKVNDIPWQEVDTLANAGPSDRSYITKTDASGNTTIQFGDGVHGMRLPTGVANVRATYRSGIGTPGNVDSGRITMLATRPLGVKSVSNPLPSTAGADSETTDQGRGNAPSAVASLDRLVSIRDYADYARTFAAIGKAAASQLSDGRDQIVYVTVAGSEGTLLDETAEPFLNLSGSFEELGDPHLPIEIGVAEFMLLVISAQVQLQDDYQWEDVAPQIRTSLLTAFGFDQRQLGQSVFLSEVITAIQQVDGVAYVKVTTLDSISESDTEDAGKLATKLAQLATRPPMEQITVRCARADEREVLQPAQVAYLSTDLPDTLILTEVGS